MLSDQVNAIMEAFMQKHSNMQVHIHEVDGGLQLRTQAPIQSTKEGRNKFNFGLETVWLQIKQPRKLPIILAKLTELKGSSPKFEILALNDHRELVEKNLPKLRKL